MSRNDLIVRLVATVIGIVAIAITAATIHSTLEFGGSGGIGGGEGSGTPVAGTEDPASGGSTPILLEYLFYAIVVILAVAVAWYLINHRRELVKMIAVYLIVGVIILAFIGALLYIGGGDMEIAPEEPPAEEPPEEGGTPGDGDGETQPLTTLLPWLSVFAIVAAIFVGAFLLSGRSDDTDVSLVGDAETTTRRTDVAAVGAAAGRAADRIENDAQTVDNEVYRAWREMTELLEVSRPETSTPGEFADAAADAGLERQHVDELTRLFEDVRYGHRETTDEMERRAVAVLRRIADEYAAEHPDADVSVTASGSARGDTE